MAPRRYTELFFLDEGTGLAAGHRPCFECRRQCFLDFCNAWMVGNKLRGSERPGADLIDQQLHGERLTADGSKRMFQAGLDDLPEGVFVQRPADPGRAYLLWGDSLWQWSPGGYRDPRPRPRGEEVSVLTPPSTVAAIRAGYRPAIHPSAGPA
jgi:hypothetical protein